MDVDRTQTDGPIVADGVGTLIVVMVLMSVLVIAGMLLLRAQSRKAMRGVTERMPVKASGWIVQHVAVEDRARAQRAWSHVAQSFEIDEDRLRPDDRLSDLAKVEVHNYGEGQMCLEETISRFSIVGVGYDSTVADFVFAAVAAKADISSRPTS